MNLSRLLLCLCFALGSTRLAAQTDTLTQPPANWFNLDPTTDHVPGVSTERAYSELLKGKQAHRVIVAVIDGGVATTHEDLKGKIWFNPREKAANGLDDDHNGYIDDVNGWNFIGGKDGRNIDHEALELTREVARLQKKYTDSAACKLPANKAEYGQYLKLRKDYDTQLEKAKNGSALYERIKELNDQAGYILRTYLKTDSLTESAVAAITDTTPEIAQAQKVMGLIFSQHITKATINEGLEHFNIQLKYNLNLSYDPRGLVGDDPTNGKEQFYGNNDVTGPDAKHGTHVSGIIAADRNNNLGIKGVTDSIKIMVVRVVPDGDERDKDIANGIRYAAANGARIISMSFGKDYSPQKAVVDEAVKYAESKGVLMIHAAGNDGRNIDTTPNFPSRYFLGSKGEAKLWIEVGASTWRGGQNLAASFSNYGKKSVDLFAPGLDIYSTVSPAGYATYSGTSMATPVVSGEAALLMSYFPKLTTAQIKEIILKTVTPMGTQQVTVPQPDSEEPVSTVPSQLPFSELSRTGGIANVYNAIQEARKISR